MRGTSVIAGMLCVMSVATFAQEAQRQEYHVGEKWVFERTDKTRNVVEGGREFSVVSKSDAEYRYDGKNTQGGSLAFATDLDGNLTESTGGRKWTPAMPLFQWPLAVGKKWEGKYSGTNTSGGPFSEERNCEVASQEQIQVKAGSFPAFKIVCQGRYRTPSSNGQVTLNGQTWLTYWYAPAAKRSVKVEYRDASQFGVWNNYVDELVSFDLKK